MISPVIAGRMPSDHREDVEGYKGGRSRKIDLETVEHVKVDLKHGVLTTAVVATIEANKGYQSLHLLQQLDGAARILEFPLKCSSSDQHPNGNILRLVCNLLRSMRANGPG